MAISPKAQVHPSAVVEDGARIGAGCTIGPFACIGPDVVLGRDVVVKSHAVITGDTQIGDGCEIYSFAVVGEIPQDLKFEGEKTCLIIGARNRIREGATLNVGTKGGGGITRVGDDCLFMTGAHVGHDAQVGNRVVMANQAALGGHCVIGDDVIIGGLSGVHQFVRIGKGAIIGALSMVANDVIPHGLVHGPRGALDGLNLIGLKRRGAGRDEINALRTAYDKLFAANGTLKERARDLSQQEQSPHVNDVVQFILEESGRAFLTPS